MGRPGARVTLNDVAAASGVSRATASFVLRDSPGQSISAATRERVREAARALGYVPNGIARALREGTSRIVVLAIDPAMEGNYARSYIAGLDAELAAHEHMLLVRYTHGEAGEADSRLTDAISPRAVLRFGEPYLTGRELDDSGGGRRDGLAAHVAAQVGYLASRGHVRVALALPSPDTPLRAVRQRFADQAAAALGLPPLVPFVPPAGQTGSAAGLAPLVPLAPLAPLAGQTGSAAGLAPLVPLAPLAPPAGQTGSAAGLAPLVPLAPLAPPAGQTGSVSAGPASAAAAPASYGSGAEGASRSARSAAPRSFRTGAGDALHALLAADRGVTAVAAFDDDVALRVLAAMREAGLSAPADLAVIGFDDNGYGVLSSPTLTTVHIDAEAHGRLAARLILGLTAGDLSPVPGRVVIRESA